jgi:hypothetical protein
MTQFAQTVQAWHDGLAISTSGFVGWLVRYAPGDHGRLAGVVVGIKDGVIYVQPVAGSEGMPMVLSHPGRLEFATPEQEAHVGRWYAANLSAEKRLETGNWWEQPVSARSL